MQVWKIIGKSEILVVSMKGASARNFPEFETERKQHALSTGSASYDLRCGTRFWNVFSRMRMNIKIETLYPFFRHLLQEIWVDGSMCTYPIGW